MINYQTIHTKVKTKFLESNNLERFKHMEEVVKMALFLNKKYNFGVSEEKIKVAGIVHDYTKILNEAQENKVLQKYYAKDEIEQIQKAKAVVHSFTAYYVIKEELGITDKDIRAAVLNHTMGRPGMTKLEELIFVSDAVENTRTYKGVEKLRGEVLKDFYSGMLLIISTTIKHLEEKQDYINPSTLETYNYYRRLHEN